MTTKWLWKWEYCWKIVVNACNYWKKKIKLKQNVAAFLIVFPLDAPFIVAIKTNKGQCQAEPLLGAQCDAFNDDTARDDDDSLQDVGNGVIDGRNHTQNLERHQRLDKVGQSVHEDQVGYFWTEVWKWELELVVQVLKLRDKVEWKCQDETHNRTVEQDGNFIQLLCAAVCYVVIALDTEFRQFRQLSWRGRRRCVEHVEERLWSLWRRHRDRQDWCRCCRLGTGNSPVESVQEVPCSAIDVVVIIAVVVANVARAILVRFVVPC